MWQRGNGIKIRESRFCLFWICSCRWSRLILDDGLTKAPLSRSIVSYSPSCVLNTPYLIAYNLTIMSFISCTLVQRETFACICWAVAVSLASSAFDSTGGGKPKCCSSDNILANRWKWACLLVLMVSGAFAYLIANKYWKHRWANIELWYFDDWLAKNVTSTWTAVSHSF